MQSQPLCRDTRVASGRRRAARAPPEEFLAGRGQDRGLSPGRWPPAPGVCEDGAFLSVTGPRGWSGGEGDTWATSLSLSHGVPRRPRRKDRPVAVPYVLVPLCPPTLPGPGFFHLAFLRGGPKQAVHQTDFQIKQYFHPR